MQRWLDRYLKHRGSVRPQLDRRFRYLEPAGGGRWQPVTLRRDPLLSFYYCSAYALGDGDRARRDLVVTDVGC